MRFLFTALVVCFLFSSCDPNNPENDWNLLTQEVYSTIEISSNNSVSYNVSLGQDDSWIELVDGEIFHVSAISEYNVIDGETFIYPISLCCAGYYGNTCSDVLIKIYQNDNLVDEKSFHYGWANEPWNEPLGEIIYCDPSFQQDFYQDSIDLVAN